MSLAFVNYTNKHSVLGNSGGTATFTCDADEWLAARGLLGRYPWHWNAVARK